MDIITISMARDEAEGASKKCRWGVKQTQGNLGQGGANGAKCYQAQAGRVQPSPCLL